MSTSVEVPAISGTVTADQAFPSETLRDTAVPAPDVRASDRDSAMAMHPSSLGQRLQVLIATDTERRLVRVMVRGRLTRVNLHGLDLVIRRTSAVVPDCDVIVDLSGARAWESVRADLTARAFTLRLTQTLAASAPLKLRVVNPLYLQPG